MKYPPNLEARCIKEGQRLDAHYYSVARSGYDCTTGERNTNGQLSRYAARRSRQTREQLFAYLDETKEPK